MTPQDVFDLYGPLYKRSLNPLTRKIRASAVFK